MYEISPFSDENFSSEARRYKLNPTSFSWHSTAMDTQQSQTGKNFKTDSKRAAVELWRAGVALATIRKQLKMSESTLAPTWTSGRRPSSWSGSRGQRKRLSCITWWSRCRRGSRRWLTGMVAWPNTKLIVKKEINFFSSFTLFYYCFFCRTSQYFPRILSGNPKNFCSREHVYLCKKLWIWLLKA